MSKIYILFATLIVSITALAADPTTTTYTYSDCDGSLKPYPKDINPSVFPDTLHPVFINYIGRHGSRYPASSTNSLKLQRALEKADSLGTITPLGRQLKKINENIMRICENQWGALDSLGMEEMKYISTRMFYNFGEIFVNNSTVKGYSSYSPRAMMSMYCFLHQLDRLNNRVNYETLSGREVSNILRPFDTNPEYVEYHKQKPWETTYNDYISSFCPTTSIRRVLGERFPFADKQQEIELAITEYYVIAGCDAMSYNVPASTFFTREEYNKLWSCFNLRQYLMRSASTISFTPAEIAVDLLKNIIDTTESYVNGNHQTVAQLRFGHAETLIPLLALLRLRGCYYMTNYFDTVALHWNDFNIVPMSANLQLILFKSNSERYYVRVDLNEKPIPLIPNDQNIYLPWDKAREYMEAVIPIYAQ